MKWMLLSFLCAGAPLFGQEVERVQLQRESEAVTIFPHLSGYFQGEIPFELLTDSVGLSTSVGWKVVGYNLAYSYGRSQKTVTVHGARIPDSCIREIRAGAIGQLIFFTDIKVIDPKGKLIFVTPMHVIPTLE